MAASGRCVLYRAGTVHDAERTVVLLVSLGIVAPWNRLHCRLTYIYINMSLKYKRWEKEQMEKNKKKESKKQK